MIDQTLLVRRIASLQPYETIWQEMRAFTDARLETTPDELWLLEHAPVFTQGQNGKPEHILKKTHIPIVQTDRGGQVTYHGPGQLMIYTLINLKRKKWQVRALVTLLEKTIIDLLMDLELSAYSKTDAPGIYIKVQGEETKICSIGLRIRRGCSYHGLAFNIAMEMTPFSLINPCGFNKLKMSQVRDFMPTITMEQIMGLLIEHLKKHLDYTTIHTFNHLPGQ